MGVGFFQYNSEAQEKRGNHPKTLYTPKKEDGKIPWRILETNQRKFFS